MCVLQLSLFIIVTTSYSYGHVITHCIRPIVHELILHLNWTTVAVIHGTAEEDLIPQTTKQQRYNIDSTDLYTSLHGIHVSLFPTINIIVAVNDTWIQRIVKQIDSYDFVSNGTTDFRHHSNLVLLLNSIHTLCTIQHLENVAAVYIVTDNCTSGDVQDTWYSKMVISTLLIHPGGRVFTRVSDTDNTCLMDRVFPNVKYGYNNRHLTITTMESISYVMKMPNTTVNYSGYLFDIWNTVAVRLNFSYDVIEPEDGTWGLFENGHWTGMVGMLIHKEVDVIVADLTVFYGRAKHIDYLFPSVMVERTDILYRRQVSPKKTYYLLLGPLRPDVYLLFAAVGAGSAIIFILTEHHCYMYSIPWSGVRPPKTRHKVSVIAWEFIGTVLRQEFKVPQTTDAGRLLVTSWWLLVLIVSSVYAANLIAALSSQTELTTLTSIQDLVESDYTVGTGTIGMIYETLKKSKRPEIRALYAKMAVASTYDSGIFHNSIDSQLARVLEGNHAFITYQSHTEKYLANYCDMALIGEPVTWAAEYMAFAVAKGSPLKLDIERILYHLKESGLLAMWWEKWSFGARKNTCVEERKVTSITMREVIGGLLLVLGGLGLSVGVLLVEVILRYVGKEKRNT